MNAYLAVVRARFLVLLQYRAAALAGVTTNLFWGAIKVMVFAAFLEHATGPQPMSLAELLVYVWLGQALLGLLPWNLDPEIAQQVRSGAVAYELLRPVDLYGFWFARTLAFRAAPTLLRMVPLLTAAAFGLPLLGLGEWRLPAPPGAWNLLAFAVSIVATLVLSAAITMLMHVALLWTLAGEGLNRLMTGLVPLFAGLIVPLPLFPDWLQPLLFWQPLRGLADVPLRLYSGHIPPAEAPLEILLQLAWAAVIVALGMRLLERGRRRLVVQGG